MSVLLELFCYLTENREFLFIKIVSNITSNFLTLAIFNIYIYFTIIITIKPTYTYNYLFTITSFHKSVGALVISILSRT
jgi:hypothetical protein